MPNTLEFLWITNWSHQINAVNLKLSKGTGLRAKIRHYVPNGVSRSLYYSFMNPYIDYNLLNWGMAAPTNLDPLNSKLKKSHAYNVLCQ